MNNMICTKYPVNLWYGIVVRRRYKKEMCLRVCVCVCVCVCN